MLFPETHYPEHHQLILYLQCSSVPISSAHQLPSPVLISSHLQCIISSHLQCSSAPISSAHQLPSPVLISSHLQCSSAPISSAHQLPSPERHGLVCLTLPLSDVSVCLMDVSGGDIHQADRGFATADAFDYSGRLYSTCLPY